MPFADYDSMSDCIAKNKDKDSPGGHCASIHKKATGKWPSQKEYYEGLADRYEKEHPQYKESFSEGMFGDIKEWLGRFVKNPIKTAIVALLVYDILKTRK